MLWDNSECFRCALAEIFFLSVPENNSLLSEQRHGVREDSVWNFELKKKKDNKAFWTEKTCHVYIVAAAYSSDNYFMPYYKWQKYVIHS